MMDGGALSVPVRRGQVSTITQLAHIPEEEIWLQKQKSARTRRAYRLDVQHFMATLGIDTLDELRQADHKAVIAWERYMREVEHAASSTIRRRLAALSSLFRHLIDYGGAARNPAREVARPAINRQEGATLAFSKGQARKLLDLPAEDTIVGLRNRAILSVGLQVGLRRAEIAALKVADLHQNRIFMASDYKDYISGIVVGNQINADYTSSVGACRAPILWSKDAPLSNSSPRN
jgi:integrase/recombinase XerD